MNRKLGSLNLIVKRAGELQVGDAVVSRGDVLSVISKVDEGRAVIVVFKAASGEVTPEKRLSPSQLLVCAHRRGLSSG
jgi:hypothetical protein